MVSRTEWRIAKPLRLALAISAILGSSAIASPNEPTGADALSLRRVPEWRAYWLCTRRASAAMANNELASVHFAATLVEDKCGIEKANYLLAQISGYPRSQQVSIISNVDLVSYLEAFIDVSAVAAYRSYSNGAGPDAPPYWLDPNDVSNREAQRSAVPTPQGQPLAGNEAAPAPARPARGSIAWQMSRPWHPVTPEAANMSFDQVKGKCETIGHMAPVNGGTPELTFEVTFLSCLRGEGWEPVP